MRVTPVPLLAAVFLVAGCASNSPDADTALGPLADQADRVAQLLHEERPCEAVEAARTLASLADDERVREPVAQAVTSFAATAESSIECPPAPTEPATPPPAEEDDTDGEDDDKDDEDNETGKDDDEDDEDKGEGRGEGKGRGNGKGKGRGNDDG